ncbi:MAG: citrate lyase subunit alpha [Fusobacteria bacterium]|nr:citrate lyase subunit alpha [Fusobacteriota bacterium]
MMRKIPKHIEGYGEVREFSGVFSDMNVKKLTQVHVKPKCPGERKIFLSIKEFFDKFPPFDGMTLSFHHHLRNGDSVINLVFSVLERYDVKDICLVSSSFFPVHEPMVKWIESQKVVKIYTNYMSGPVAKCVSSGKLKYPVIMQTHGGRARAIESGEVKIDVAFIAAPSCDEYGNMNGVYGKSACGVLGYAHVDADYANHVVAITDNLVPYPNTSIEIFQHKIDSVIVVESIGNPKGIVSGTTQITKDPLGLKIAKMAAKVIEYSGYLKEGFSFQTGAGGTSLAVAKEVKKLMISKNITGSFASGGITGYMVEMLKEGLFKTLFDVQCFDLDAIQSVKENPRHQAMSASLYGNPHCKGAIVNNLDVVILGATEVDINFNVNVTTASNGMIMGGSGGHSDTAAGAKLTIIVTNLVKARLPIVKEMVTTITTPGESVDVVVTERGIAVNPKHVDLIEILKSEGLSLYTIEELKEMAYSITGVPSEISFENKIIGVVEYRDGSVIDVIYPMKG